MSSTSTLARPLLAAPEPEDPPALGLVLLAAVVRAALIAVSGLVLVLGVALLLWAVTPNSGSEPTSLVRGGIGAFAAAHLLPVTIGTTTLTLPPMLLTLLFGGFLAAGAARGRIVADGLVAEAASVVLGAAAYTAVVLGAVYLGAPAGAVDLRDGWRAGLFALVAASLGTAVRGTAWRARWIGGTPHWLQVGVRTGVAGLMMLVAGGAVVLVVALVRSVTTAAAVGEVAAPTAGDALGMAVLGVVYLPTAVLAATGYATGPGFQIGAGTYSPLGSHGIELPAVPLLAAVPPTGTPHLLTLVVFLVPVVGRGRGRRGGCSPPHHQVRTTSRGRHGRAHRRRHTHGPAGCRRWGHHRKHLGAPGRSAGLVRRGGRSRCGRSGDGLGRGGRLDRRAVAARGHRDG